jgi:hypothetical protein
MSIRFVKTRDHGVVDVVEKVRHVVPPADAKVVGFWKAVKSGVVEMVQIGMEEAPCGCCGFRPIMRAKVGDMFIQSMPRA